MLIEVMGWDYKLPNLTPSLLEAIPSPLQLERGSERSEQG